MSVTPSHWPDQASKNLICSHFYYYGNGRSRKAVQGVGPRFERYYDLDWQAGKTRTRLVVIGETGLNWQSVSDALRSVA